MLNHVKIFYYMMTLNFCCFIIELRSWEHVQDTLIDRKSGFDLTARSAFSKEDEKFSTRSFSAMLARNMTPLSHKKIADNYTIIKKVFKFQAVASRITNQEKAFLSGYDFGTLEYTTAERMYDELALLRTWSTSGDKKLSSDADKILEIRSRELKFLETMGRTYISNEIYQGYSVLENYFNEISKYPA